jgi:DNA-binding NarL/FixJ family response regulator
MNAPIRVLLVDDHPLVRAGVRRVLESDPRITIVGEAQDGPSAQSALQSGHPDVMVLDLSLPGSDGFEILREARLLRPELRVIILTMHANREYITRALQAGADSYLLKDSAVQDLLIAIESVCAGRSFHSPRIQSELSEILRDGGPGSGGALDRLTEREREVLREIAAGRSTKEIASRFGIGSRTVETHRANLMRKLDLHSVALLTRFAIKEGLLPSP